MKKIITILMLLMMAGATSAAWYPRADNYTTSGWIVATSGADIGGPLYVDGAMNVAAITGTIGTLHNLTLDETTGTAPMTVSSTTKVNNLNVDQVDGKSSTDFVLRDGTQNLTANWNVGGYKIANLGTAATTGDAASIEDVWLRLNKSGDSMSGSLAMGANNITGLAQGTTGTDAVTKDQLDAKLNKSGDTMSGALAMGGQKITGLATATTTGDAASIEDVWSRANKTGDTFTGPVTIPYLTVSEGLTLSSAYSKVSSFATDADYNYTNTSRKLDQIILVDARGGNRTITLPAAAAAAGNITTIKANYDPTTNFVRINVTGDEVMLTGLKMLYTTNDTTFLPSIRLYSDGGAWTVLDEYPLGGWTAADA